MKITSVEVRACQRGADRFANSAFRTGDFQGFEFLVVTLGTDSGLSASSFGFAGGFRERRGAVDRRQPSPFCVGSGPARSGKGLARFSDG